MKKTYSKNQEQTSRNPEHNQPLMQEQMPKAGKATRMHDMYGKKQPKSKTKSEYSNK